MSATTGIAPPEGYRFVDLASVDSTNAEARRRAEAGEEGPLVIRARSQTAGRGRKGRIWDSPAGNLYMSLLLPGPIAAARAGQLSFVAAVATAEAVARRLPGAAAGHVRCKWPNDILLEGRKLGGILIETAFEGSERIRWAVVGIGLNLVSHPEDTRWPATDLAAAGVWDAEPAARDVAAAFDRWYRRWLAEGFAPVRAAWTERAYGMGKTVRLVAGGKRLSGTALGIADDGALLLRPAGAGVLAVHSGEIVPPDDNGETG